MTLSLRGSRTAVACLYALAALACAAPSVAHATQDAAPRIASTAPDQPDGNPAAPPARQRRMDAVATTPPERAHRPALPAASADPPSCHARPVMTMCRGVRPADAKRRCMRCLDQ